MGIIDLITQETVQAHIGRQIGLFVGKRGKKMSVETAAALTGLAESTIVKVGDGETTPAFFKVLRLLAVVDEPSLVNSVLGLIGYGGAYRLDATDQCPKQTACGTARFLSALLVKLEDGRIDHIERPEALAEAEEALVLISQHIATLKAAGKRA